MVPLGAVLHNPPGSIGGRQPANPVEYAAAAAKIAAE